MLIFIVSAKHPCRKIKIVEAEVIHPGKWTWAVYKGRRYLIGASAFYTLPSAWRSKVGHLTKIVNDNKFIKIFQPDLWTKAKNLIKAGIME